MTIEEALYELGVRDDTLTPAEKQSLDRDGFVYLHDMLPHEQAKRMSAECQSLFATEHTCEPGGKDACEQIQNKSDLFDICFTHPRLLAAVYHVLRADFVSQGIHSRPNPPGKGKQTLHQDGGATTEGRYVTCNSIWPLADFTAENGATRIVPGTHRSPNGPETEMTDLAQPHPRQVQLIMPLGSVAVFSGGVWHSAVENQSHADRPNVTSFWARRDNTFYNSAPSESALRRMTPAVRRLFPDAT